MAAIHVSATEASRDFAGPLSRVRAGAEVVIEDSSLPVVETCP
jgi:antitoxin (DNA-binding transcriptional repressor) of toxin-antitoxin stability system